MRMLLSALLLLVASPSQAEEMPLVKDNTRSTAHLTNRSLDIRGLQIGQSRDEAIAVLKSISEFAKVNTNSANVNISDSRGNRFSASYPSTITTSFEEAVGDDIAQENYQINLTPTLIGNRVGSISRRVTYRGAEVALDTLLAGIESKYGSPSLRVGPDDKGHSGQILLYYIWFGAKFVTLNPSALKFSSSAASPARCVRSASTHLPTASYFKGEIRDQHMGCSLALKVSLRLGKRDDLVRSLSFETIDFRRINEQALAVKQYMEGKLEEVKGAQKGVATPKL